MAKIIDNKDNTSLNLQEMMFEQMKRLSNPDNDLEKEIKRSQALSAAGTVIINAEKVKIDTLRVQKLNEKPARGQKQLTNGN
jgi:hypothetical protein